MWSRTVGSRKYVDPDVASLIDRSGGLIDPHEVVRICVSSLLEMPRKLDAVDGSRESSCLPPEPGGGGSAVVEVTERRIRAIFMIPPFVDSICA